MTFALGTVVRTKRCARDGHTRLPLYLAEKRGRIVALRGAFALADRRARNEAAPPETVYTVRFDASDLWGAAAEAAASVYADLWESYLDAD